MQWLEISDLEEKIIVLQVQIGRRLIGSIFLVSQSAVVPYSPPDIFHSVLYQSMGSEALKTAWLNSKPEPIKVGMRTVVWMLRP